MSAPDKAHELRALLTAAMSFVVALLGWVGIAVAIMLACMVLDYITGTWAAKAHAEWTSTRAREGLWHKLGEIVALCVAALCDIAVGVILSSAAAPLIGDYHHRGYITLIVGSILENAAKLGAPIPEKLIKGIGRLKKKADDVDPVPGKEDSKEEPKK